MEMGRRVFGFVVLAVLCFEFSYALNEARTQPVTDICLGCICNAVSKCNLTLKCEGSICGLFGLTWAYWADGQKPTVGGQNPEDPTAYANCANDPRCAAVAVQEYMRKYERDCNGDGVIDCYDHMRIHKLGPYGCHGYLPEDYSNRFNACLETVKQRVQQG